MQYMVKKGAISEYLRAVYLAPLNLVSRVLRVCAARGLPEGLPYALRLRLFFLGDCSPERVWVISMARLRTLPPVHLPPIDVLVLNDPYMEILS